MVTICVDGVTGKKLTLCESNSKAVSRSRQTHDTRIELAGVGGSNDARRASVFEKEKRTAAAAVQSPLDQPQNHLEADQNEEKEDENTHRRKMAQEIRADAAFSDMSALPASKSASTNDQGIDLDPFSGNNNGTFLSLSPSSFFFHLHFSSLEAYN